MDQINKTDQNPIITFTLIQSPINKVLHHLWQDSVSVDQIKESVQEDKSNFQEIRSRLESNIKKIEKRQMQKTKIDSFKEIKGNILKSYKNQQLKTRHQPFYRHPLKDLKFNASFEPKYNYIANKQMDVKISENTNNSKLQHFLRQLSEVKQQITNLKTDYHQGTLRSQKKEYQISQTRLKERQNNSSSKYEYTNYRDMSNKKYNFLTEKKQGNAANYHWLRKIEVKEFEIIPNEPMID